MSCCPVKIAIAYATGHLGLLGAVPLPTCSAECVAFWPVDVKSDGGGVPPGLTGGPGPPGSTGPPPPGASAVPPANTGIRRAA